MKIDGKYSTPDTDQTRGTDAARKVATERTATRGTGRVGGGTDTVDLSSDAKLMAAALKATDETPAVRTELVEQMKQKLAAGEIGNDSGRLADRIIGDLLKR